MIELNPAKETRTTYTPTSMFELLKSNKPANILKKYNLQYNETLHNNPLFALKPKLTSSEQLYDEVNGKQFIFILSNVFI